MGAGFGRLLFICLNPAWQRSLTFDRFVLGQVNRARGCRETGGGKGVNAARAARILGVEAAVALFRGGDTGKKLRAELEAAGIACLDVSVEHDTRTCTTIMDDEGGQVTELIEPSGPVSPSVLEDMRKRISEEMDGFDGMAICGTFPPGIPPTLYGDLVQEAKHRGLTVLFDGVKGIDAVLEAGVDILKINADELRLISGKTTLIEALRQVRQNGGARWVAVTDGPGTAWLAGDGEETQFRLPHLDAVRGTTGAGDAAAGVMLAHCAGKILTSATVRQAFVEALAAASASCLTDGPAIFERSALDRLRSGITLRETSGGSASASPPSVGRR